MRHPIEISGFDNRLQGPTRKWTRPRLALRQRTDDHPLAMLLSVAAVAFLSMAFIPTAGPAFASIGMSAPAKIVDDVRTTPKGDRLKPSRPTEIACHGQAWGAESSECLVMIAKEAGRHETRIRMIASAEPNTSVPNIF